MKVTKGTGLWLVVSKKYYNDKKYGLIVHEVFKTSEEAKAKSEAMNIEGKETFWGELSKVEEG